MTDQSRPMDSRPHGGDYDAIIAKLLKLLKPRWYAAFPSTLPPLIEGDESQLVHVSVQLSADQDKWVIREECHFIVTARGLWEAGYPRDHCVLYLGRPTLYVVTDRECQQLLALYASLKGISQRDSMGVVSCIGKDWGPIPALEEAA